MCYSSNSYIVLNDRQVNVVEDRSRAPGQECGVGFLGIQLKTVIYVCTSDSKDTHIVPPYLHY